MGSQPCRRPAAPPAKNFSPPRLLVLNAKKLASAQAGVIAATLDDLVEMGLLETFVDQYQITRYRPTGGRVA